MKITKVESCINKISESTKGLKEIQYANSADVKSYVVDRYTKIQKVMTLRDL